MYFCTRFVSNEDVCHGFVLLNYTKYAGSVEQRVDASGMTRTPDQVLALMVLPRLVQPRLMILDNVTVEEDSSDNCILVSSNKVKNYRELCGDQLSAYSFPSFEQEDVFVEEV